MNWRRFLRSTLILFSLGGWSYAQDLNLLGLNHVGIAVSDIDKSRLFYHDVLGLDMAFDLIKPDLTLFLQYYKVNDHEYVEIYPTLKPDSIVRETHIAFYTDDIQKLHQAFEARGLDPTPVKTSHWDGNQSFDFRPAPGQDIVFMEFVQYMPGSLHSNNFGKALSGTRISTHMRGVGVLVKDPEIAETLYKKMGFKEIWRGNAENGQVKMIDMQLPGPSGDYVELVERPMPVKAAQAGRAGRIILEVEDIKAAHKLAKQREASGLTPPLRVPGKGWSFDVFDPDGTMVSFEQPLANTRKAATP
jgi:catechol 2,3-dioxygenase-like lactoylglutathione lyase family enzyme